MRKPVHLNFAESGCLSTKNAPLHGVLPKRNLRRNAVELFSNPRLTSRPDSIVAHSQNVDGLAHRERETSGRPKSLVERQHVNACLAMTPLRYGDSEVLLVSGCHFAIP